MSVDRLVCLWSEGLTGVSKENSAPAGIAALTAAVSIGDAAAVEAFYRRYFDPLYAEARRVTRRDEAFCLDVVHDAVLRIVRTIRAVESEGQLVAWLRLVVRTAALDAIRSERRRRTREAAAQADRVEGMRDIEREEQIAWLRDEIAAFDPDLARIIELRYAEQWTLRRIAGLLGLSIGTVDGRLRRALEKLRDAAAEVGHA